VIGALILATVRAIVIDGLVALGALCLTSIVIAAVWAFLFRHRRRQHIDRRGHP
jgi:uncharacterized membrane protein